MTEPTVAVAAGNVTDEAAATPTAPLHSCYGDAGCCSFDSERHLSVQRALFEYVGYPVLVCGIVGHVTMAIVLLSSRALRTQPLSVYLLAMAAAASLSLLAGLLPTIVDHQTCWRVSLHIAAGTQFGCSLLHAVKYFGLQAYSWFEGAIAVERLLAMRWPLQCQRWCTLRANVTCAVVIALVLLPINAYPYVLYGIDAEGFCEALDKSGQRAWKYAHLTLYAAAPVALMLPCNGVTLYVLAMRAHDSPTVKKARSLTVTMLSLNCLFVITTVPLMAVEYSERISKDAFSSYEIAWSVCRLVLYAGEAFTCVVYAAVAAKFRRALLDLLLAGTSSLRRALSRPAASTDSAGHERCTGTTALPTALTAASEPCGGHSCDTAQSRR